MYMPLIRVSEENVKRIRSIEFGTDNAAINHLLSLKEKNKLDKLLLSTDDFEEIRKIIKEELEKLRG